MYLIYVIIYAENQPIKPAISINRSYAVSSQFFPVQILKMGSKKQGGVGLMEVI